MAAPSTSPAPAADSPRYTVVRPLGRGASGGVYLALDGETGGQVALKKLFRLDQKSVQRFKREFRSLTDLSHPNLVKVFDLHRGSDAWCLTMEYIDGIDLHEHLNGTRDLRVTRDERSVTKVGLDPAALADVLRIFHELASGVRALHSAGLLHRDLKPNNVMVARDGRVVVLDFGLIRELDEQAARVTQDGTVAGTPAYMAPEQAFGGKLSEASDWYAFGVMLYEALAGSLPIDERNIARLVERKLTTDPLPLRPEQLGVPKELTDLCMELLYQAPEQRPPGRRVIEVLAGLRNARTDREHTQTEERSLRPEVDAGTSKNRRMLIGREHATLQLSAAFAEARSGGGVVVSVCGGSGAGKTALIEQFLDEAERGVYSQGVCPLVLRSRCYERESMPFKALDGVMDALVQYLGTQDDLRVAHLVPSGVVELTQLFPTFQRLRVVQRLLSSARPHPDATHARQRAEQSLRELIDHVAEGAPVIAWIDDLQWGDLDSVSVLSAWLAQRSSSPLMLILSYRSEELDTSACLRALDLPLWTTDPGRGRVLIQLEALGENDVHALCMQRLPFNTPPTVVERIVAEAHGNPYLALQLSALAEAKQARGELELQDISLGELVLRTSALLPPGARAILDVLAIAGRPTASHLALRAADVASDGRALIHELRGLRLLRTRLVSGERLLELYHDRVREALQSALSTTDRQRVHDSLLRVLEFSGRADADWLHELALGAGDSVAALRYGLQAAERADKTFAFARAVDLYQRCLGLATATSQQAELLRKLAEVLARSRRGAEAADAYLAAAERVESPERLSLLRLAASHMLRTGRFEEGEALVQRVLEANDITVPASEVGLYAAIGWERTRAALRGPEFERKAADAVSPELTRRLLLYAMLSVETQFYAPLRAVLFQARALRMALASGDPELVARVLCLTATVSCIAGTERAAAKAESHLARAEALSAEVESHDLRSELFSARTTCSFLVGNMAAVLTASEVANRLHDARGAKSETGDYYYLFTVQTARIGALLIFGRYTQAARELRDVLARADATANRTAILQVTTMRSMVEQGFDRASESRPRLDREREELPRGIGLLHMTHLIAVLRTACYTFDFDWAFASIEQYWDRCLHSPLRHGTLLRYLLHSSRARMLLNHYVTQGRRGDPGRVIRDDMRALRGIHLLRLRDPARNYEARLAYLRGDVPGAVRAFRESTQQFAELGLLEEAARERFALGCLLEGEVGARMRTSAQAESLAIGIVNPRAMLHSSYPEILIDTGF